MDLLFPKWQRELFNTILDEEKLKADRDGQARTAYSLRAYLHLPASDGGGRYLPDREELQDIGRDDRKVLCLPHQDPSRRCSHQHLRQKKVARQVAKELRTGT
jgi:hypothetical protein